jgi:glycerol uptake facilitator-like aquaporin
MESGAAMKLADVIRFTKTFKMDDAQRFAQHVVPEVVRPARVLWNQAIGGIFLLFAAVALGYSYSYYQKDNPVAFGFSIFFGLVMGFFSLTSFLQARKIARRAPRRT